MTDYRDSPLWSAVAAILTELTATGEIVVNTAPDYVIAYTCRELVAKRLVNETAVRDWDEGSRA